MMEGGLHDLLEKGSKLSPPVEGHKRVDFDAPPWLPSRKRALAGV